MLALYPVRSNVHCTKRHIAYVIFVKADNPIAIETAADLTNYINKMWYQNQNITVPDYQMQLMYGSGCYRIDQSNCPNATYAYYHDVNSGVQNTFIVSFSL